MKKIAVGSISPLKVEAVKLRWPDCQVIPCNVSSEVAEQPTSMSETMRGAMVRAVKAFEPKEHAFAIGIESGMWGGTDYACCVLFDGIRTTVVWSKGLVIPEDHPPGPNGRWSALSDPHRVICGESRRDFLVEALKKFKE